MAEVPERYRTRAVRGLQLAFRRMGGDAAKPFIDVFADALPGLARLRSAIAQEWPGVHVVRILCRDTPHPSAIADQHVLWGNARELARLPSIPIPRGYRLSLWNTRVIAEGPNGWAGVVLSEPGSIDRFAGEVMQELFVAPEDRGVGLGAAMQRLLIDSLEDEDDLIGTILATNAPSLATARRCGRTIVATYWWVPLAESTWLDELDPRATG